MASVALYEAPAKNRMSGSGRSPGEPCNAPTELIQQAGSARLCAGHTREGIINTLQKLRSVQISQIQIKMDVETNTCGLLGLGDGAM